MKDRIFPFSNSIYLRVSFFDFYFLKDEHFPTAPLLDQVILFEKFNFKIMNILDYRMAMDVTAGTTILNLFLLRPTNVRRLVLEIQVKSVVIRGDSQFTDRNQRRLQLQQHR